MKFSKDLDITTTTDEKPEQKNRSNNKSSRLGIRHLQCFMLFYAITSTYSMRVTISEAIVVMTDNKGANPDFPEYDWDEQTKSLLLSSFSWGYVITQIPAGILAGLFGVRLTLLVGVFISSLLNILTPVLVNIGDWKMLLALRIVEGLFLGVVFPSTHSSLSQWACIEERGLFTVMVYSGSQCGTFIMLALSGVLASSGMGWPSIFYFSGSSGLIFCVIYFLFGASSPNESKLISSEELKMIESSQSMASKSDNKIPKMGMKIPWFKIFTSPPFLAVLISHCCHLWGYWTLLTEIPSYMKNVLHKDIKSNALLSSLPYFANFVLSFVFAGVTASLIKYKWFTLNISRKFFNTIGLWFPMLALIGLGFVDESQVALSIALLTLSVGMNSAVHLGFQPNSIDLAPNFAGVLMGIANTFGNVMSILAPLLVGFVVTDNTDREQWRIIFYIAAVLYFIGNLFFIIFGRTNTQDWNDPETNNTKNESNEYFTNGA